MKLKIDWEEAIGTLPDLAHLAAAVFEERGSIAAVRCREAPLSSNIRARGRCLRHERGRLTAALADVFRQSIRAGLSDVCRFDCDESLQTTLELKKVKK